MIKLFWCPRTRAIRALWMLEELACDFEVVEIDIRDEASRDNEDFKRASPMGKVPAILDGDIGLSDFLPLHSICVNAFLMPGLLPALGDPARADFIYWMLYTPGVIEPAMAERFGGWEPNKLSHGWGDFDTMIRVLEERLADREWLVGDTFSAADVMVGSSLHFVRLFGIMPEGTSLHAYVDRCTARPAFKRAVARDDEAG